MTATEWWLLATAIVSAAAAVLAVAGLGPVAERVRRALGHAAVGLLAVALAVSVL